jgi:hypothetical protein
MPTLKFNEADGTILWPHPEDFGIEPCKDNVATALVLADANARLVITIHQTSSCSRVMPFPTF